MTDQERTEKQAALERCLGPPGHRVQKLGPLWVVTCPENPGTILPGVYLTRRKALESAWANGQAVFRRLCAELTSPS